MPRACRWLIAVILSLALHGLLVAVLTRLPGQDHSGAPAAKELGANFDPTDDREGPPALAFLVPASPRRPPKAAPPPPAPVTIPSQLTPLPMPAQLDPLAPPSVIIPVVFQEPPGGVPSPSGATAGQGAGVKGQAMTSFFQVPAQGDKVVYVIDRSASMGIGRALEVAQQQLLASLQQLPPSTWFQVIVYNATAETLLPNGPEWLEATPDNKWRAAKALKELRPEGATRHEYALPKALELRPDAVFFLTDADDLPIEHLNLVTRRNGGRAVIHVIELSTANRDRAEMPLQVLARANRGTYQAVDLRTYR